MTICRPASSKSNRRSACVANIEPFPGRESPNASVRQFIELAVNIPEQEPHVGQAARSISATSSSELYSEAVAIIASTKSTARFLSFHLILPASIGPPETKIVGIFNRKEAINIPGVILSQLEIQTSASAQWALTIYSTESAMISREGKE
ncbi:Uncharacterised protein [Candidatus Bartonella washoeensis]|nr:Uncharacterised protein [Bartonella washoeensis]